jgi:methenyltetrahydromethanopterin cyclohydrolase
VAPAGASGSSAFSVVVSGAGGKEVGLSETIPPGRQTVVPASASRDYGEPFGNVLEQADWDFYKIDPLLFSPAEVRLVSVASGRSFHAGGVDMGVLERSFRG